MTDIELDSDGNFDMVFYTDYYLHYCNLDLIFENNYLIDSFTGITILEEFRVYYIEKYLDDKAYIINQFTGEITDDEEKREVIKNIIKWGRIFK